MDDTNSNVQMSYDQDLENLSFNVWTSVFRILVPRNGNLAEYEQVLDYFTSATDNAERKHK